jgi:lysozyme
MADRGFDGTTWTREEFTAHLNSITLPSRIQAVTIHCVAVPMKLFYTTTKSEDPDVDAAQRMRNMFTDVRDRLKGVAYHAVSFPHGQIGKATDMLVVGNHASSWNADSLGIEMFFDGDSNDPFTPGGEVVLDTAAWWAAQILQKIKKPATASTVRFHRDEPAAKRKGKTCPGKNVHKDQFLKRVLAYMATDFRPENVDKPAPKPTVPNPGRAVLKKGMTGGDVPVLQRWLKTKGYYTSLVDGDFGPKTNEAVKAAQKALGLVVDGIVGPKTWAAMANAPEKPQDGSTAPKPKPEPIPPLKPAPVPPVPVGTKREPIGDMHMSQKGLDLLKHFEGLRLAPYDDNGSLAIGYGHSNRSRKPPIVTDDLRITAEQAVEILAADLVDYENRVKQSIAVPLKQGEFDALVSLAYNWGPGNLDRSELKQLINAQRYKEAEAEIRTILPSPDKKFYAGIKRRRGKEADLFGSD